MQVCLLYKTTRHYKCNDCITKNQKINQQHYQQIENWIKEDVKATESADIMEGAESSSLFQSANTTLTEVTQTVTTPAQASTIDEITLTSSEVSNELMDDSTSIVAPASFEYTSTPQKSTHSIIKTPSEVQVRHQNVPSKTQRKHDDKSRKICRNMKNKGKCRFGNRCMYDHPDLCSSFIENGTCPKRNTCTLLHPTLCRYDKECRQTAIRCNFMHTKRIPATEAACPSLEAKGECGVNQCPYTHYPLCRYWIKTGVCNNKNLNKCKFRHPKLCPNSLNCRTCAANNCEYFHIKGTARTERNLKPHNITTYQNRTQAKASYNPFPKTEADSWKKELETLKNKVTKLTDQLAQIQRQPPTTEMNITT